MNKQRGQSMTEYLVVLGVTGAGLLAATSDVTRLFDNVQDSYRTQSSEMSKVQIYSNPKFQTNPVTRDEEVDEEDPAAPQPVLPEAQYPPVLLEVYDASGQYVGKVNENDMLVDEQGNEIAWCKRQTSGPNIGQCVFVDAKGNEVLPGATTNAEWVDDNGNPLVLQAMTRGDQVVGFAYLYNEAYYDAVSRKRLDPQPTNLTGQPTRKVTSVVDGKTFTSGYEVNGYIYSEATVQGGSTTDFSTGKTIDGELVSIEFANAQLPTSDPAKYKPCVVSKKDWSVSMNNSLLNSFGFGDNLFLSPTSYIDTSSADCNGRNAVRHTSNGAWEML